MNGLTGGVGGRAGNVPWGYQWGVFAGSMHYSLICFPPVLQHSFCMFEGVLKEVGPLSPSSFCAGEYAVPSTDTIL